VVNNFPSLIVYIARCGYKNRRNICAAPPVFNTHHRWGVPIPHWNFADVFGKLDSLGYRSVVFVLFTVTSCAYGGRTDTRPQHIARGKN